MPLGILWNVRLARARRGNCNHSGGIHREAPIIALESILTGFNQGGQISLWTKVLAKNLAGVLPRLSPGPLTGGTLTPWPWLMTACISAIWLQKVVYFMMIDRLFTALSR